MCVRVLVIFLIQQMEQSLFGTHQPINGQFLAEVFYRSEQLVDLRSLLRPLNKISNQ